MSNTYIFLLILLSAAIAFASLFYGRSVLTAHKPKENIDDIMKAQRKRILSSEPKLSTEGLTWQRWLDICIKELQILWYPYSYDEAANQIKGYLDFADVQFPDPSHDWTESGAKEIAHIVSQECGEQYGSN